MNPYLQPPGFLGTGASLLADITLLAYILLIVPGMVAGYVFARRGQHRPHHKTTMIAITAFNWLLIIFLMLTAYSYDVIGNIASQPTNARYLLPTIHGAIGLVAQLLATYVVIRMLREDSQVAAAKKRGEKGQQLSKYWFTSAKTFMRITIVLWLITSLLGVFTYLIRYDLLPKFGGARNAVPAVTAEPAATSDPSTTAEPGVTPEVTTTSEPATTAEPGTTPEVMMTEEAATATPKPSTTAEPGVTPEVTP
jgi:uncharacterized membrane protein YozB (DUF420 family)